MRLGYVIIYVPDLEETVAFYEKAFGVSRRFIHESGYAEMETGATALAFATEKFSREQWRRDTPKSPECGRGGSGDRFRLQGCAERVRQRRRGRSLGLQGTSDKALGASGRLRPRQQRISC